MQKIICVDIDGTLTDSICWTIKDCLSAKISKKKENQKIIQIVRRQYQHNFIIIYTARRDYLISATLRWLRKNDIPFHAISNNKIPADYYLDSSTINIKDLL